MPPAATDGIGRSLIFQFFDEQIHQSGHFIDCLFELRRRERTVKNPVGRRGSKDEMRNSPAKFIRIDH